VKRREFMTLVWGVGVAAWPLAARAQASMPVIGFLSSLAHTDLGLVIPGFREGLKCGLIPTPIADRVVSVTTVQSWCGTAEVLTRAPPGYRV